MKDIFKVAMLQMERSSDINNNIKKGIKFCKNAKLMGADIAVFPEMWSNGYEILFRGLLKNQKDLDMNKVKRWQDEAIDDSSEYITEGNIGYLIYPLDRGHGYAKEASEVLLKYAYDYLGMKNIRVTMLPNNEASKHIAESLGGTYIEYAKVPKCSKLYGTIEGVLVYNIDLESKKGKSL